MGAAVENEVTAEMFRFRTTDLCCVYTARRVRCHSDRIAAGSARERDRARETSRTEISLRDRSRRRGQKIIS